MLTILVSIFYANSDREKTEGGLRKRGRSFLARDILFTSSILIKRSIPIRRETFGFEID